MRGASVRNAVFGLLVWWCTPMAGAEELRLQAIADTHPLPAVRDFAEPELIGAALRLSIPRWPGGSAERKPSELYPLHWAALTNQPLRRSSLIEHGTAADTRDGEGRTPLMVAAAFDSPAVAEVLLAHGADPRARDTLNGNTPLDFAALSGHAGMARDAAVPRCRRERPRVPQRRDAAPLRGALRPQEGDRAACRERRRAGRGRQFRRSAAAIRDEAQADAGGGHAARPRREAGRPARRRQCRRCCARPGADWRAGRT